MKKNAKLIVLLLSFVFGLMTLTACGGSSSTPESAAPSSSSVSSEESAVSDVDQIKESLQGSTQDVIRSSLTESTVESLKQDEELMEIMDKAGIDPEDYASAMVSHVSIEPGEVTVDGDQATVELTMTLPDFSKMDEFQNQKLEEKMKDIDQSQMTEDEMYKAFGQVMLEIAKDPDMPVETQTLDVKLTMEDGQWVVDQQAIMDAFTAGQNE